MKLSAILVKLLIICLKKDPAALWSTEENTMLSAVLDQLWGLSRYKHTTAALGNTEENTKLSAVLDQLSEIYLKIYIYYSCSGEHWGEY